MHGKKYNHRKSCYGKYIFVRCATTTHGFVLLPYMVSP